MNIRERSRGFSLLEVLVAFTILALSLGILMQIFSGSLRNAQTTHDRVLAVALAQSILAGMGVETALAEGELAGIHDGKYRWQVAVSPYHEETQPAQTAGATGNPAPIEHLTLWHVSARVSWDEGTGSPDRSITLATLRLQPVK